MQAVGRQATLPDFGLFDPLPLQTEPPRYLHTNDLSPTEPTYIADVPPAEPKVHVEPHVCPGEQVELHAFAENACPVCHRPQDNISEHLLTTHQEAVNARLEELKAEQEQTPNDYAERVVPIEPVMFGEVAVEHVGERLNATNPRECNDCGTLMSVGYKRTFGHENGDLWCPDCRSRAERYTNDPARRHGSYSHPEQNTGTDNPRYNWEPEPTT